MDRSSTSWWIALLSLAVVACDPATSPPAAVDVAPTTCVAPTEAVPRGEAGDPLERWAKQAVDGAEAERSAAIAGLRAAGPRGLEVFVRVHGDALADAPAAGDAVTRAPTSTGLGGALVRALGLEVAAAPADPAPAIDAAIDGICRQHACRHTQLYWYTDLEAAKAEARASGRPILSLRLLGDLGEALSCANSRFFRSILYPAVASTLRERFVLHWSSERPAPVITVDFGDGRRLTRTITGNSVHFVLDAEGRPIDALPGLMTPTVFTRLLERAAALELETRGLGPEGRAARVREHHQGRLDELAAAYAADLRAIGEDPSDMSFQTLSYRQVRIVPRAGDASILAASKSRIEAPILGRIGLAEPGLQEPVLWSRLALRHRAEARIGPASLRAMGALEEVDVAKIAKVEESLAVDSVRNEYELHREIHRWFAFGQVSDLGALGRRIYDELFLTPASDPSLGLAPADVFAALPGGGWSTTRP